MLQAGGTLSQASVLFSGRLIPANSWWTTLWVDGQSWQTEQWKWSLKENEGFTTFYRISEAQHGKFCQQVYEPASIKLYPTV